MAKNPLHCSFCRKSQHEVKKLVAGPAVYICDICTDLCLKVMQATPDPDPGNPPKITGFDVMPTDQLLKVLGAQDTMYREVRDRVQESVDTLRSREVSWQSIGEALGISRQAAWERFS